jgi:photosystem II stability/assembly factor-like uncharacterized protein
MVSVDGGDSWTTSYPTVNVLQGVAATSDGFVAVGRNGTIFSSQSGLAWTQRNSGTERHLFDIAYHDGVVIAVGDHGTLIRAETASLDNWAAASLPGTDSLRAIEWLDSLYVAVGTNGSIFTSSNGTTWTEQLWDTDSPEDLVELKGATASDTRYVAVGVNLNIVISDDVETWTRKIYSTSSSLEEVVWTGSRFVAVGWGNAIFTSP